LTEVEPNWQEAIRRETTSRSGQPGNRRAAERIQVNTTAPPTSIRSPVGAGAAVGALHAMAESDLIAHIDSAAHR
jgi:hypothetical protein